MTYRELAEDMFASVSQHPKSPMSRDFSSVTEGEHYVLGRLTTAGDGVPAGDLSRGLGLTTGRIAIILGNLERKGLVQRKSDPSDKRMVIVFITEEGKKTMNAHREHILSKMEHVLAALGENDANELVRIIKRIVHECPHDCKTP